MAEVKLFAWNAVWNIASSAPPTPAKKELITKLIIEAAALSKQGKTLEGLIENLREAKEEKELRFKILCDNFRPEGEKIIELFENEAKVNSDFTACNDNHEGIRINSANGNGWFLIRLSVHDPIIVLNSESDSEGGILKMFKAVYDVMSKAENIDKLDISALTDYIKEE